MTDDTIKETVSFILSFSYGCTYIEWINDGNSVVFKDNDNNIKYARIQYVESVDDSFIYNRDTFAYDKTVFQYSKHYIRIFNIEKVKPLLIEYKDSITKNVNGDMVCPLNVVEKYIVDIPKNKT